MVSRTPFQCLTCAQQFALRVGIGHEPRQRHFFLCPSCEEECSITLEIDFQKPDIALTQTENCERLEKVDPRTTEGWPVVNLHPDFVIPFEMRNTDNAFPWLEDMNRMFEQVKAYHNPQSRVADLHQLLNFNDSFCDKWRLLSKALGLHLRGRTKLARDALLQYKWVFQKEKATLWLALRDFCRGMLFPGMIPQCDMYGSVITRVKTDHPEHFAQFMAYYSENLQEGHLSRYRQIFDDYFRDYTEYKQTLNYIRCALELPEGSYASSRGFDRVRMLYGNAFEVLTSHFVVPACLNNISDGREFDKFKQMTIARYLTIDKANRGNPFKSNGNLSFLLEGVDTHLRNASHHADIRLLKGHDTIEYRSGKSAKPRTMTYARYIHFCNMLVTRLFILFWGELSLRKG